MDPITALTIGSAAASLAGGVAQGVGTARAGKKMMLSPEQQAELKRLEKLKREGKLGLSGRQRGAMEQRFLAEQAGAQREIEASALQQAAARGLSGAASGRDIFLQEMAEVQGRQQLRQQQNIMVQEANERAAQEQRATIDALRAQQQQAEATRAQGIAQAVSGGLVGAAQGAATIASQQQAVKMAEIDAQAKAGTDEDILRQLQLDASAEIPGTMGSNA